MTTPFDDFEHDGKKIFLTDTDFSKVPYNELAERADALNLLTEKYRMTVTFRLETIVDMLKSPSQDDDEPFYGCKELSDLGLTAKQCRAIAEFLDKEVLEHDSDFRGETTQYLDGLWRELVKRESKWDYATYTPLDARLHYFEKKVKE